MVSKSSSVASHNILGIVNNCRIGNICLVLTSLWVSLQIFCSGADILKDIQHIIYQIMFILIKTKCQPRYYFETPFPFPRLNFKPRNGLDSSCATQILKSLLAVEKYEISEIARLFQYFASTIYITLKYDLIDIDQPRKALL